LILTRGGFCRVPWTLRREPVSPMSSSAYKNVGIASLIMMGSVFLSRVVGLVR
jgi:hypothetical protein